MPEPTFPFTAIEGQAELQLALILAAIAPRLGGVLIEGPRGTAKTTTARALADLLDPAPFVTVPLGCSMEHLTGSLDLAQVLNQRDVRFAPGLLAKAHGGVLYVDEINLLPDALVDVLLDAAASGINHVERDGISHRHAASFVLVGTMNPQEGALRPQLLDRLGLCVSVNNVHDASMRQRIVRTRLAFDHSPEQFLRAHAAQQALLKQRLQGARTLLEQAPPLHEVDERVSSAVAKTCMAHHVDGLRADMALLRAAQALAAWEATQGMESTPQALLSTTACVVRTEHVQRVAAMVLRHRQSEAFTENLQQTQTSHDSKSPSGVDLSSAPHDDADTSEAQAMSSQGTDKSPDPPSHESPERDSSESSEGNWGGMSAEPTPRAQADNPLLQRWLKQLSHAAADSSKKF